MMVTLGMGESQLTAGLIGAQVALLINPLEIAKTRHHLVGEKPAQFNNTKSSLSLTSKISTLWRIEGIKLLTKGSAPSAIYCAFTNISSLQMLKYVEGLGFSKPSRTESFDFRSSVKLAAVIGLPATVLPSPFYLVKIRNQSKIGGNELKYGFQHNSLGIGTLGLLKNIYKTEVGPWALYRAALSAYIKFTAMMSLSIYSYTRIHPYLQQTQVYDGLWNTELAALLSAFAGAFIAAPLDLISTRLYNQGVSRYGRGMFYSEYKDCLRKLIYKEGLRGVISAYSLPTTLSLTLHSATALYLWNYFHLLYRD